VRPEDFDAADIAHALAMKCRYNGHSREFYTVAEHSVYVSIECERRYPDRPSLWLWGLLHDLGEAYLPDVPRPVKHMGVGILKEAEIRILSVAARRFGLDPVDREPPEVKQVDAAVLAAEAAQIMARPPNGCAWYLPEPPADLRVWCLSPFVARARFLSRWRELGGWR
jgi:5'-deoxynucleotidase YfbR-like HD superfamily hydrolase